LAFMFDAVPKTNHPMIQSPNDPTGRVAKKCPETGEFPPGCIFSHKFLKMGVPTRVPRMKRR